MNAIIYLTEKINRSIHFEQNKNERRRYKSQKHLHSIAGILTVKDIIWIRPLEISRTI